ncbi:MAG: putative bifunctional diguanylate cyclase/phosphodiesterase, partial [Acidimicrobiales bacterium]
LIALVATERLSETSAAIIAIAVAVTVLTAIVIGATDRARDERVPSGALVLSAGHVLAAAGVFVDDGLYVCASLPGAALTMVGSVLLVRRRRGSRATITERETGILASGLGLTFFVLFVEPRVDGDAELLVGILETLAVSFAFFTIVFLIWLVSHDSTTLSVPLVMAIGGQIALVVYSAIHAIPDAIFDVRVQAMFPVAALGLVLGATVHATLPRVLIPAVITASIVDARRSLISFLVVLLGPLLVGIDQFTQLSLSLPALTVGSGILSLLVASHLLRLIRHLVVIEHQGQHDPLTSLPNRPLFFTRLELALESARLRDASFATMFLDLDRFKAVNDTLGHDAGDELLRQVARRLADASVRVSDDLTVARLGGDEFAILVPTVKDERHSHAIGRLFLDQFLEPFDVGLRDIYVTPSIGLAQFPKDGGSVEELIENADTAMFEAKERGRNMVVSYSPEQRVPGAHRLEIEAALHRAIDNEELHLFYQPQVDITTGEIFAVEALIRWVHPTLGQIGPDRFVPVAEESSLIDSIGEWTIAEACRTAAHWANIGLPPINVAVNLSPRQFQKSVHLTDTVSRALSDSGLEPSRLELELTESLALEKPEEVNETLTRFRQMGIRTAIDDFGVGHTGLDYLDRIEVDTLKIDRSFINRIGDSGAPLVTAVISLARGLNLDVIAEGVETKAQVDFLRHHGCRFMQGYLFSKPLTGAQLERVLRNQIDRKLSLDAESA